uniref:Mitochondrial fission 1 protein n=1 Tax=Liposcelis bostrychophila TaxID=185214 RepID=A0A481SXR3_LIPBO|nr:hypothetical protein [Liposcelis bostrychophila]
MDEEILNEIVPSEDLKKFERIYYNQLNSGSASKEAEFEYSWCLVRSKYPADIRKGIMILEQLYTKYVNERRDYLYYLALGNARLKEYSKALQFCRAFLQIEPTNHQVQQLETVIKKKMDREGKLGLAIATAGVLALGGIVGLGVALAKGKS